MPEVPTVANCYHHWRTVKFLKKKFSRGRLVIFGEQTNKKKKFIENCFV